MKKKEKLERHKECYEKPQMKKVYSTEHNRSSPFPAITSSGGGCDSSCGSGCGCDGCEGCA